MAAEGPDADGRENADPPPGLSVDAPPSPPPDTEGTAPRPASPSAAASMADDGADADADDREHAGPPPGLAVDAPPSPPSDTKGTATGPLPASPSAAASMAEVGVDADADDRNHADPAPGLAVDALPSPSPDTKGTAPRPVSPSAAASMAADGADADDRENADPPHGLAVDSPPPPPDTKEKSDLRSDSPASPQSSPPILGENKEPDSNGIHTNSANTSGNGEESNSNAKKRNVFRPSVFDRQTDHHDRWCSDNMEPNPSSYQNRWKEMDKESSSMNKTEQLTDDSRNRLDSHCHPQECWGNSTSKEGNYDQRHDNKWNSRWGSTGKTSENWRDKCADSGKQNDASREKIFSQDNNPVKDTERDSNLSRSWNSSYLTSHGTRGTYDHPSRAPQKLSPSLGYGRERQQSENPNFTSSHRRFTPGTRKVSSGSSRPFQIGILSNRPSGVSRDSLSYSRMKLLEIYRKTDARNFVTPLSDIEDTSLLWQEDSAEPLALTAPSAEEAAILKGIDKGEITSSEEQVCQDDGGDQAGSIEDSKSDVTENIKGPREASLTEPFKPYKSTYIAPQKSQSVGDHIHGLTAKFMHQNNVLDQGMKIGEMAGMGESDIVCHMQPHPENLSLYYKDPQGQIQGPFPGSDIIDWFEAGYFGIDLLVSVSSAPPDAPLQLLGDVMPHLREKARPPPGFSTLKPSSMPEPSNDSGSINKNDSATYLGISDYGSINKNDSATDVENHFLESPMSSNIHNPKAETSCAGGMNEWSRDIFENNFICGNENVNGINYHVAQRAVLERENPFQTEGDVILAAQAQKDTVPCLSNAKWFPQMVVSSSETLQSQNVDLLLVPLSAEKHQAPTVSSGLQLWSDNFESGSVDHTEGLLRVHHNLHNSQQIGVQQHHSLTQNQPTFACLNSQITYPEKFLSEISQDPPLSNIMQQQYLLQPSLQPQQPGMPQPQPSLFSNMLPLRQQEQHLSQVLPDDRSAQQLHHPSYETKNASVSSGNCMKLCLQRTQELLDLSWNLHGHGMHRMQLPDDGSVRLRETDVLGFSESQAPALPLPHEMIGHSPRRECLASLAEQREGSVNEVSQESTANSPFKKTTSWSNEVSKLAAFGDNVFPESCQDHANSENVLSNISNQMEISSGNPHPWKVTPGVRPKSMLTIQAEEQLKAQRELAKENAKVTVTAASVSSIPWSTMAKGSVKLFGDVTKSTGDLESVNITRSTRNQSHDLLTEKVRVKSNNRDAATVVVNDASFPPPVPHITQSGAHSHNDSDFVEVKNSKKKSNKAEKSKGSAAKPLTLGPFDPSVISVPVKKDSKQVQQVKDASQREAMEFREWCENEWTKLTGTNDTSFLEFLIKQPASEAEMLLVDNIGSLDHNRNFIDKFLSYKAFLSADVIDMAFRAPISPESHVESPRPGSS